MELEKTLGPYTTISLAGIELDPVLMEARLSQENLDECRDLISPFFGAKLLREKFNH